MTIRNTSNSYGTITRTLHILLATTVILVLLIGTIMGSISNPTLRGEIYNVHKVLGVLAFFEIIFFIVWSLCNVKPGYPNTMNNAERFAARAVQTLLYILVLTMTISGWVLATGAGRPPLFFGIALPLPFGIKPSPSLTGFADTVHVTTAWIIGSVVALHFLAALKHHFFNKDFVLRRMFKESK